MPLAMFPLIYLLKNMPGVNSHPFLYYSPDLFLLLLQVFLKDHPVL